MGEAHTADAQLRPGSFTTTVDLQMLLQHVLPDAHAVVWPKQEDPCLILQTLLLVPEPSSSHAGLIDTVASAGTSHVVPKRCPAGAAVAEVECAVDCQRPSFLQMPSVSQVVWQAQRFEGPHSPATAARYGRCESSISGHK